MSGIPISSSHMGTQSAELGFNTLLLSSLGSTLAHASRNLHVHALTDRLRLSARRSARALDSFVGRPGSLIAARGGANLLVTFRNVGPNALSAR